MRREIRCAVWDPKSTTKIMFVLYHYKRINSCFLKQHHVQSEHFIMRTAEILSIYHDLQNNQNPNILSNPLNLDIHSMNHDKRPNSASVEDAFFGDSGKGAVVAKLNERLAKKGKVFSLRANGGANAGHEADINGKKIVTHQIPMGVVKEGATAFISRGMVLHPEDVLIEIDHINKSLDTPELPGNLIIDYNTPLALDTHRAYESVLNQE